MRFIFAPPYLNLLFKDLGGGGGALRKHIRLASDVMS